MRKQALVIGLGQFGMALARSLSERGVEVLAVDANERLVQTASAFAAEAVAFDATDEESLVRAGAARRDLCVCAIGGEARDAAIIVTALLRQMGAPYIAARATDDLMERILRLVGAHEVINPERAYGERLANRLLHTGIIDEIQLGPDLILTELRPPAALVGRNLAELALPRRFEVTVVAIRRMVGGRGKVVRLSPTEPLQAEDILVVVAPPGAVQLLSEKVG